MISHFIFVEVVIVVTIDVVVATMFNVAILFMIVVIGFTYLFRKNV